ncbi:MAG: hypothetical protein DMG73_14910, partial [Acidobacteria bacterium]
MTLKTQAPECNHSGAPLRWRGRGSLHRTYAPVSAHRGVSMPARKRIILLIEDEQQQLSLHEMVLELSGYTVLTASSGRQGLALLSSHRVDEVLLDY